MPRASYASGHVGLVDEPVEFRPQRIEVEYEPLAARDRLDAPFRGGEGLHVATVGVAFEDLERARVRIHEPVPADTEHGVVGGLFDTVAAMIARTAGDHLDQEVGWMPDESVARERPVTREPGGDVGLAPPS